jgi:hypothetical protein
VRVFDEQIDNQNGAMEMLAVGAYRNSVVTVGRR